MAKKTDDIAAECRRVCARNGAGSWTESLIAYVAVKEFRVRVDAVAPYMEHVPERLRARQHVLQEFNRFALALTRGDPTALRLLGAAWDHLKEEEKC